MKQGDKKQEYFTQSLLLEQGWTKGLIAKFLPEPDATATNPIFKSVAPIKLYSAQKINAIMQSEEYKLAREKMEKRRLSAQKAADNRRKKSLKDCREVLERIVVDRISLSELRELALEYQQCWYDSRCFGEYCADEKTVRRWMVNYIRHNMTHYDDCLMNWKGRIGIGTMYISLRNQVLDKIAEVYPELKDECKKQRIMGG